MSNNNLVNGALLQCPVCKGELHIRLAQGRKSGKPSIMVICPSDGRHFRGFITDQPYVADILSRLEDRRGSL